MNGQKISQSFKESKFLGYFFEKKVKVTFSCEIFVDV